MVLTKTSDCTSTQSKSVNILRYYQKSIIKEEIEEMRLRRGMHWHEVRCPPNHLLYLSFSGKDHQQVNKDVYCLGDVGALHFFGGEGGHLLSVYYFTQTVLGKKNHLLRPRGTTLTTLPLVALSCGCFSNLKQLF